MKRVKLNEAKTFSIRGHTKINGVSGAAMRMASKLCLFIECLDSSEGLEEEEED